MVLPRKPVPGEPVTAQLLGRIIDYMRRSTPLKGPGITLRAGPGGTVIGVKQSAGSAAGDPADGIYPFLVRFVASEEEGATPIDGDYIVYIPQGSLSANGTQADPADFGLEEYAEGDYEDVPGWYSLPYVSESGNYWLNFVFTPAEEPPFVCSIDTQALYADPESQAVDGIARSVALAAVTVVPPGEEGEEDAEPGSVTVRQTTRGPLAYDFGVESLNGAMGNLSVVGDREPVSIDGENYYVTVTREEGSSDIVIGLSTDEPDDDDGKGYCNNISHDGQDSEAPGNDISGDSNLEFGPLGGGVPDNSISRWPCRKPADNGGNT